MGHWGYEPKDSDGAWDLLHVIDRATQPALLALARKNWPKRHQRYAGFDRAGVVQLLLERGVGVPLELFRVAVADLERARDDEEWMRQWVSRRRMRRALSRILAAFNALYRVADDDGAPVPNSKRVRRRGRKTRRHQRGRFSVTVMAPKGWPRRLPGQRGPSWTGIEKNWRLRRKKRTKYAKPHRRRT
jgi:hypothetical protein